jgi:UDP-2-acetamido-2-deoxy-ribo-hexuluronate aminotransferase
MAIPFIDLKAQYARIEEPVKEAIMRVLEHGRYIMGPEITELELQLAEFAGVKHAIGCSSGTDALLMPLMAYEVGPGDAVFTTPFTFFATAEVIAQLGATPVFVDIDPETYNIDPEQLALKIAAVKAEGNLVPRGIIPVDLFGLPADYDAIMALADAEGLFVLEDAAQGFGALYKGRRAGSLGHVAATSFFPAKPLGAYGDGGAVFTNDDQLYEKMLSIRVHGQGTDKYTNVRIGLNARLDSIQAAVLLEKLKLYPEEIQLRQHVADKYTQTIKELCGSRVQTPVTPEGLTSVWAQYSVQADNREEIQAALKDAEIPTMIYYPIPLHLQEAFADLQHKEGDFPVAEAAAKRIFSLPFHPYLSDADIEKIVAALQVSVGTL